MTTLEQLQKENELLKKENRWLRVDSTKRSFYCQNRIINMQIDLLNDFDLSENIKGKKSENATFERMQSLWKELPKLVSELNNMRSELKIDGDDNIEDEEVLLPISPEMIASE